MITDQQGNAWVSVQDNGSGTAVVRQENSYYAFGMILPNSPVGTLSDGNKQLYNGGSEWQNDYGNLPDYQQTFYRNYDAALGRFVGVDPLAEGTASLTGYHYANNNPVMFNDPMGDAPRLNSFENTGQLDEMGAIGSSGFMDYGKLRYDKMMERSSEERGGFFWDSSNGQFMPTENQINKVIAQYGGMRVVITPEIATAISGRNLTFENGELGFYRYNGIKFFNEQNTGVTDADGHYLGNSYHTYTFVALQGGNDGSGSDGQVIGGNRWNSTSNTLSGLGMAAGAADYQIGRALSNRMAYQFTKAAYEGWKSPVGSTAFKTIIGAFYADTKLVQGISTSFKVGGAVIGAAGMLMTTVEVISGKKQLIGEGGLDLIMGGVGFIPGGDGSLLGSILVVNTYYRKLEMIFGINKYELVLLFKF